MCCFVNTIGEAVSFRVMPMAHGPAVECWARGQVLPCKFCGIYLLWLDPVFALAGVFVKTGVVLICFCFLLVTVFVVVISGGIVVVSRWGGFEGVG